MARSQDNPIIATRPLPANALAMAQALLEIFSSNGRTRKSPTVRSFFPYCRRRQTSGKEYKCQAKFTLRGKKSPDSEDWIPVNCNTISSTWKIHLRHVETCHLGVKRYHGSCVRDWCYGKLKYLGFPFYFFTVFSPPIQAPFILVL